LLEALAGKLRVIIPSGPAMFMFAPLPVMYCEGYPT